MPVDRKCKKYGCKRVPKRKGNVGRFPLYCFEHRQRVWERPRKTRQKKLKRRICKQSGCVVIPKRKKKKGRPPEWCTAHHPRPNE